MRQQPEQDMHVTERRQGPGCDAVYSSPRAGEEQQLRQLQIDTEAAEQRMAIFLEMAELDARKIAAEAALAQLESHQRTRASE